MDIDLKSFLDEVNHDMLMHLFDKAILVTSPRAAERVLASVTQWIEKHLKVPVNREKSGSGPTGESALLGFRLEEDGTISIAPKSIQRLKSKVRGLWEARQNLTSEQLRDQWQRLANESGSIQQASSPMRVYPAMDLRGGST